MRLFPNYFSGNQTRQTLKGTPMTPVLRGRILHLSWPTEGNRCGCARKRQIDLQSARSSGVNCGWIWQRSFNACVFTDVDSLHKNAKRSKPNKLGQQRIYYLAKNIQFSSEHKAAKLARRKPISTQLGSLHLHSRKLYQPSTSPRRVWKGIDGIRELTETRCGILENVKFLDRIRDSNATRESGFAKILTWDAILGKETVLGIEMTEVRDTGQR